MSNIELMKKGKAPFGYDGKRVELHHMTQGEVNGFNGSRGALAEVSNGFHRDNYNVLHIYKRGDPEYTSWRKLNPSAARDFDSFRERHWMNRANDFINN